MAKTVTVTRVDGTPADGQGRVRHFDELDEADQTMLAAIANGYAQCGEASALTRGDVVVFTDYYEVVDC
ncbi:MAG: hypothetical protein ABEJ22_00970 [Haloferacaceae archaeon]